MGTDTAAQQKRKSPAEVLRERKTAMLQAQIERDEKEIAELETSRDALQGSNVIGMRVRHRTFGDGTITGQNDKVISVLFASVEKRFVMPAAFVDGFLSTDDRELNENLDRYQQINDNILLAKEDRAAASRAIQSMQLRRTAKQKE